MKIDVKRRNSFKTAENHMKALKSFLIKLPTLMALVSSIVFFIIAICSNPIIPIRLMHQSISLFSQTPLSFLVWLLLFALMGVLTLTRRKPKQ